MLNNTDAIKEFNSFATKVIEPAVTDIGTLQTANRKHVQRLAYTNLVDRFDYMVDRLILDNCRDEYLVSQAFKKNDNPVTESDLVNLLIAGDNLQDALTMKLQDRLRLTALRDRHSQKLRTVLSLCDNVGEFQNKPRVNISTGEIVDSFKIQIKERPHSICGHADWLYSRRNAIVHGAGGSTINDRDVKQIKKLYNKKVKPGFRIKLNSVTHTATFYKAVTALMTA